MAESARVDVFCYRVRDNKDSKLKSLNLFMITVFSKTYRKIHGNAKANFKSEAQ